jgi:hypothetical protein
VEVFARGDDDQIYRRVVDGGDLGSWAVLGDLDGSIIDNRSDLDCAGNATDIHVVAVGNDPPGALLRAVGFGTTYNDFARVLEPQLFTPSASVAINSSGFHWLSGLTTSSIYAEDSGETARVPNNLENLPFTGLDSERLEASSVSYYYLAVFDSVPQLAVYLLQTTQGGTIWRPTREFAPPPDTEFEYSPTICKWRHPDYPNTAELELHLAVTAGGRLWHAHSASYDDGPWSEWELVDEDLEVTSAPDCVSTPDGSIHIVALDRDGGVVVVSGSSEDFTTEHLGGHPE